MTTLLLIAEQATSAGCYSEWVDNGNLLVFPTFDGDLVSYSGDISFEVKETLVGLRFVVVEHYGGFMLSPIWPEDVGLWVKRELRDWCSAVYWWTFRNIWGWQVSHPWESLEQTMALTREKAEMFQSWCESTEVL